MMNIHVDMVPVAKGRPRTCTKNGRTWTYTDKKTVEAEKLIRECAKNLPKFAEGVPLAMDIVFVFLRPKSAKKRLYPPGDIDNYEKLVIDALQGDGNIIPNDSQIIQLRAIKRYGVEPFIDIEITEVNNAYDQL